MKNKNGHKKHWGTEVNSKISNDQFILLIINHIVNSCLIPTEVREVHLKRNGFFSRPGRGRKENKWRIREENLGQGFIPDLNRQPARGCPTYHHPFKIINAKVLDGQFSLNLQMSIPCVSIL